MLFELIVPQSTKMLNNLTQILEKGAQHAETKKFDAEVLWNSRLAPDQFNLIRQVQIACDTVKLGCSRLTGKEAPKHDDSEKTLPELKARIQDTLKYVGQFSKADFNGSEEKHITQPRWEGKYLTGAEYAYEHVMPNMYFHVMTVYSILRHNGVEVGKKDYLGEMPYKK